MNNSDSKELILDKIRNAKTSFKTEDFIPDGQSPIFKAVKPSDITCFKNELETVSGHCVICKSDKELAEKINQTLKNKNIDSLFCKDRQIRLFLEKHNISFFSDKKSFETMQAGITACELLVARTGSVVVSSAGDSGRQMNIFPPIHIVLAKKEQLVELPEEALISIQEKYGENMPSLVSFISGPSRTADIEKTLVLGAHGPKELYVFII